MSEFRPPPRVLRLKSAPSTQTLARRLAVDGAPAGTVVRADRQTRGRGRLDRRWSSGRGGLYFSMILRPRIRPAGLAALSLRAGRTCARALAKASGLRTAVKLPNDVLAFGGEPASPPKKVCGILIEAAGGGAKVDWVVVGVGVNVNNRIPAGLPGAASLRTLAGREFDADDIFRRLERRLARDL